MDMKEYETEESDNISVVSVILVGNSEENCEDTTSSEVMTASIRSSLDNMDASGKKRINAAIIRDTWRGWREKTKASRILFD